MKAVKGNVVISQFQSNFEHVFFIWFDAETCCLTVKRSFKVCNLEVAKNIYLEKKQQKKAEQEKGKVLYWSSSAVGSNCPNFKIYVQKIYLPDFPNPLSFI